MPEPDLRYPIGKFQRDASPSPENNRRHILEIEAAPAQLRRAVAGLTSAQIDTPYRPEGWTVRQTVHHLADSHMNAYVRFKLALTEDAPTIKLYDEALWAQTADNQEPVEISLALLEALHQRWSNLLQSMKESDYTRTLVHPENGVVPLHVQLAIYGWHGRHHAAHITALRERNGWK
jgi:DinB superfamily